MEVIGGYNEELEQEIKRLLPEVEIKREVKLMAGILDNPLLIGVTANIITLLAQAIWVYLTKRPNAKIKFQERIIVSKDDSKEYLEKVITTEMTFK